jgi:hypothetical protein
MIKNSSRVGILLLFLVATAYGGVADYLVLADIASYKLSQPQSLFPGEPPIGGPRVYDRPGILGVTDHFPDPLDKTYEVMYIGGNGLPSPTVQVTQHAGSDSDRWLLHELDDAFRDDYGISTKSYVPRQINGQTILVKSTGGRSYRWLKGAITIAVEYTGSLRSLPEPLEVVQAYLAKHPSSLPAMTLQDLRSATSKTTWIKDEMERRLWLCDKWFMQLQAGKADQKTVLQESVKSMTVFLNYREKYFSLKAADEKTALTGYLAQNNGTGIKAKLADYKAWWVTNKTRSISVP